MKFQTSTPLLTQFSVSSLTDIVMLLLIFFLLTSSFVSQPGIKVQLPKAETGATDDDMAITVTLTERGEVFLNAEKLGLEALGTKLQSMLAGDANRVVTVQADRTVSLQQTVQIIDIAKAAGAHRFMIATQPVIPQ